MCVPAESCWSAIGAVTATLARLNPSYEQLPTLYLCPCHSPFVSRLSAHTSVAIAEMRAAMAVIMVASISGIFASFRDDVTK